MEIGRKVGLIAPASPDGSESSFSSHDPLDNHESSSPSDGECSVPLMIVTRGKSSEDHRDNLTPLCECDYDKGSNALFRALQSKRWSDALGIIETEMKSREREGCFSTHIEVSIQKDEVLTMAATWIKRMGPGGTTKWRINPLHAAVIFDAPCSLLEMLIQAYPEGNKLGDDEENLPLHLAYKNGLSRDKIDILANAYSEGMNKKNRKGLKPRECAIFSRHQGNACECDYDKGANALFNAIQARRWNDAIKIIDIETRVQETYDLSCGTNIFSGRSHASTPGNDDLVVTWISRMNPDGTVKWRITALHAAVIFDAPCELLEILIQAFPYGTKQTDDKGNLPLHLAFRNNLSISKIDVLVNAFPMGMEKNNKKGLSPMECMEFCPWERSDLLVYMRELVVNNGSAKRQLEELENELNETVEKWEANHKMFGMKTQAVVKDELRQQITQIPFINLSTPPSYVCDKVDEGRNKAAATETKWDFIMTQPPLSDKGGGNGDEPTAVDEANSHHQAAERQLLKAKISSSAKESDQRIMEGQQIIKKKRVNGMKVRRSLKSEGIQSKLRRSFSFGKMRVFMVRRRNCKTTKCTKKKDGSKRDTKSASTRQTEYSTSPHSSNFAMEDSANCKTTKCKKEKDGNKRDEKSASTCQTEYSTSPHSSNSAMEDSANTKETSTDSISLSIPHAISDLTSSSDGMHALVDLLTSIDTNETSSFYDVVPHDDDFPIVRTPQVNNIRLIGSTGF